MSEPTEKSSLAEAIEKGREICRSLEQLEHLLGGPVIDAKEGAPVLRRLVEASELWLRFGTLSEDFIKTLDGEKDHQIQALRRQLDELGKEKAEVEERLATETSFKEAFKMTAERHRELTIKIDKKCDHLRSQLAEKTKQIDNIIVNVRDDKEQLWKRIRSQEKVIERLEDELDEFRLLTTPGFVDAMALIDEGLTKGKLEIEKVRKVTKLVPDDAPTEAEVEKVAQRLRRELFGATRTKPFLSWSELDQHTRKEYCAVARHVIERGYRREE